MSYDKIRNLEKLLLARCSVEQHFYLSKMSRSLKGKKNTHKEISMVRSSAAEYLTFVAASGSGGIEALYADENV